MNLRFGAPLIGAVSFIFIACTGAEGPVGPAGPQGPQGPAGATGAIGLQGSTGENGMQGPIGPTGATGAMGPQGPAGEVGPMGPAGPQGLPGESVVTTALPVGDADCPTGGASFEVGADGGMTFACNGEVGPTGAVGATGAAGPQGPQGIQGIAGPMGPAGPAGSPGVLASAFTTGFGASTMPTSVGFISSTVLVTLTSSGQKVYVNASKALGTNNAGGAANLNIWICSQSTASGSTLVQHGGAMLGLRVPANTRLPFALSADLTGLAPGTYNVGLCGQSDATNAPLWNSNEYSYVTALVHN